MKYENQIIQGDTLEVLKSWPDEFVDLIITSPPYYGLRKYGDYEQQIGLEKTFDEFLKKILEITAELKRVLKPNGQFWLNFGDCYGTGSGAGNRQGTKQATNTGSNYYEDEGKNKITGYEKSMLMMPERIAIKMCDEQGWILRNKVKWAKQILDFKEKKTKGSVMPTSVQDRFNESGEELYFFVKSKRYYSDLDAVRMPNQVLGVTDMRAEGFVRSAELYYNSKYNKAEGQGKIDAASRFGKGSEFEQKYGEPWDRFGKNTKKANKVNDPRGNHAGGPGSWRDFKDNPENSYPKHLKRNSAQKLNSMGVPVTYIGATGQDHNLLNNPAGKNLPTVWLIGSEPHNFQKELGVGTDHFAIFPQALVEIPIKFGCPPGGLVLDPFSGSRTVALVARSLGRSYLGIELNKEYIELSEKRLGQEILNLI